MPDLDSAFLTFTQIPTDPNFMGYEAELKALHQRTEALDRFLTGEDEPDILLDMLAEHGQDPTEYVECVENNVQHLMASKQAPNDIKLWLPYRHGV